MKRTWSASSLENREERRREETEENWVRSPPAGEDRPLLYTTALHAVQSTRECQMGRWKGEDVTREVMKRREGRLEGAGPVRGRWQQVCGAELHSNSFTDLI